VCLLLNAENHDGAETIIDWGYSRVENPRAWLQIQKSYSAFSLGQYVIYVGSTADTLVVPHRSLWPKRNRSQGIGISRRAMNAKILPAQCGPSDWYIGMVKSGKTAPSEYRNTPFAAMANLESEDERCVG